MRTDSSMMEPLLEGFAGRTRTSDGLAAHRSPMPFPDALPVDVDVATDTDIDVATGTDIDLAVDEQAAGSGRPLDLHDTLQARRSSLRYGDAPVRTDLILGAAREALSRDAADWALDDAMGPLEAFVFALRSEGRPAGVYRVTAGETSFIAPASAIGDPELLGVQREFADAAGIVTVCANLDAADSWAGAHGFRLASVRASMALYDLHLRCQSHGLAGTVFGGFIAAAARNLIQSDGVTRHPLLSATYAHPAS
ncbi:tpaF [Streptomyces sp. NPDC051909]|uniref:tpaF n=1 Tax=Streptomyces sp. NPDC051909 TaxID=3154944 RepID=UPI003429E3E6